MGNRHGKVDDTTLYSPNEQSVAHKRREKPKRIQLSVTSVSRNNARNSHNEPYSAMPNPLFSYTSTCSRVDSKDCNNEYCDREF